MYSLAVVDVRSLKSRCWQECVPSGGFRELILSFTASPGDPYFLTRAPFLAIPQLFVTSPTTNSDPPAALSKDACNGIRQIYVISKSLNHICKVLFTTQSNIHRLDHRDLKHEHLWGGHYWDYYNPI